MKFKLGWALVALIAIFFIVKINIQRGIADREVIAKWADSQDFKISKIENCNFSRGPFFTKAKYQRIYEATLSDGRTYWFRFGWNGYEVEKYP